MIECAKDFVVKISSSEAAHGAVCARRAREYVVGLEFICRLRDEARIDEARDRARARGVWQVAADVRERGRDFPLDPSA